MSDTDRLAALRGYPVRTRESEGLVVEGWQPDPAGAYVRWADLVAAGCFREAPAGTRLVPIAEVWIDDFEMWTRRGERVTAEWGEPDADGFYAPVFTVHPAAEPATERAAEPATERARIRAAVETLFAAHRPYGGSLDADDCRAAVLALLEPDRE